MSKVNLLFEAATCERTIAKLFKKKPVQNKLRESFTAWAEIFLVLGMLQALVELVI